MIIPTVMIDNVFHIGTMENSAIGKNYSKSLEGNGLSVSLHPNEWSAIAKISMESVFLLSKKGAKFISVHDVSSRDKNHILEWAEKEGIIERVIVWRLREWDSDDERWTYSDFKTRELAVAEVDEFMEKYTIRKVNSWELTAYGQDVLENRASEDNAVDMAIYIFSMEVLRKHDPEIVGVWWNDELDPYSLSAPRGVIFNDEIPSFQQSKIKDVREIGIDEEEAEEILSTVRRMRVDDINLSSENHNGLKL